MKEPLISIIVPVYNVERYLPKCINSILNQTYGDFELILIDDGSPDKCPAICDRYAQKDKRIRVFHKNNGGVSSARNYGIQVAKGNYISFVDSDDWLPKRAIEMLMNEACESGADLVYGNMKVVGYYFNSKSRMPNKRIHIAFDSAAWLDFIDKRNGAVWAQVYKTNLLRQYHVFFPEDVKSGEDTLFVLYYLSQCTSISLISETVYVYNCFQQSSATKTYHSEYNTWMLKCVQGYDRLLRGIEDQRAQAVLSRKVHAYLSMMCVQSMRYMKGGRQEIIEKITEAYEMVHPYLNESDTDELAITLARNGGSEQVYNDFTSRHKGIRSIISDVLRSSMQNLKYCWYYKLGMF